MNTWAENATTLWTIITDYLMEQDINIDLNNLKNEYDKLLKGYYNKRFDYEIEELNRFILFDIHEYIGNHNNINTNVKLGKSEKDSFNIDNKQQPGNNNLNNGTYREKQNETILYTNEELRERKIQETQQLYDVKKREFESYSKTTTPNKISFEDEMDENNENLDDIYKRTIMSRNYDVQYINDDDKKKAEEWINNSTSNDKDIVNQDSKQDNKQTDNVERKHGNDVKVENKKVSFLKSLKRKMNTKKVNITNTLGDDTKNVNVANNLQVINDISGDIIDENKQLYGAVNNIDIEKIKHHDNDDNDDNKYKKDNEIIDLSLNNLKTINDMLIFSPLLNEIIHNNDGHNNDGYNNHDKNITNNNTNQELLMQIIELLVKIERKL